MKEADNLVDVAMLTILNTGKALGHSAKSGSPEGSIFTMIQAITFSGPPNLFLG